MASSTSQASDHILSIETPLLRVPLEALRKYSRDRLHVLNDLQEALDGMQRLAKPPRGQDVASTIDKLTYRLTKLKRKCSDLSDQEGQELERCAARVQHMQRCGQMARDGFIPGNRLRLDQLLVDYLHRMGYMETADEIIREKNLQDVCDEAVFRSAQKVITALRERDCSAALRWCTDNRAKLRKLGSRLEFRLRLQEFVELARQGEVQQAITYARKNLGPVAQSNPKDNLSGLQAAMAVLLFRHSAKPDKYKALFDPARWEDLVSLFCEDLTRLHQLPPQALLCIHLQAGLSVLKTSLSYDPSCTREDPLHLATFQKLAEELPYSQHTSSKLTCSITKMEMNEENPPIALPNGYVYSARALEKLMADNNGTIKCPQTGEEYTAEDRKRVFIV